MKMGKVKDELNETGLFRFFFIEFSMTDVPGRQMATENNAELRGHFRDGSDGVPRKKFP